MFEMGGWALGVLFMIPVLILVLFILNLFDIFDRISFSMSVDNLISLIVLLFLLYYIIQFSQLALTPETWGLVDGEFMAEEVEQHVEDSTYLLLMEGIPVMITIMALTTIFRISYWYFEKEKAWGEGK